jgi:hypothetical protein
MFFDNLRKEELSMSSVVYYNGKKVAPERIDRKDDFAFNEIAINRKLKDGCGYMMFTSAASIGGQKVSLIQFTIEPGTIVSFHGDVISTDLLFPYEEFSYLENRKDVLVKTIGTHKCIQAPVTIKRSDLIMVTEFDTKRGIPDAGL